MKNELCYYCDLSVFKSIIENREFWLSDIHFMNDSSEESLFLDALTDVMKKMREKLSDSTKSHLDRNSFIDSFFTNIKHNYKNMLYICCFTDGKNDDLSQWRGYASDGTGLCIGLKKNRIKELSKSKCIAKHTDDQDGKSHVSTSFIFAQHEIYYSNKADIMKELEEIIAPIIEEYDAADKKTLSPPFPDSKFTQELFKKIHHFKAFYKNQSFKPEKEYRICFFDSLHEDAIGKADDALMKNMKAKYTFPNGTELSELRFRVGRGALIPYRVLKFSKETFDQMLSSVTIGPKNPMSIEDVKYFLISNGIETSKIEIKKSESTYQ